MGLAPGLNAQTPARPPVASWAFAPGCPRPQPLQSAYAQTQEVAPAAALLLVALLLGLARLGLVRVLAVGLLVVAAVVVAVAVVVCKSETRTARARKARRQGGRSLLCLHRTQRPKPRPYTPFQAPTIIVVVI